MAVSQIFDYVLDRVIHRDEAPAQYGNWLTILSVLEQQLDISSLPNSVAQRRRLAYVSRLFFSNPSNDAETLRKIADEIDEIAEVDTHAAEHKALVLNACVEIRIQASRFSDFSQHCRLFSQTGKENILLKNSSPISPSNVAYR
jgi:hypothetical protein